jgi:hypothetical protein
MQSESKKRTYSRFNDLVRRGIVSSYPTLRHLQKTQGFPLGILAGPGIRIFSDDEIDAWLASRPVEPSAQTQTRAAKSIAAQQAIRSKQEKLAALPTARQMLDKAEWKDFEPKDAA